ncbi:hypothetical protein [Nostoc sp. NMS8]|uniref:hypothetical protein n=1 Tax=Nostoc sp. NMS8 TaxID=2815392 RepID=UPI0025EE56FD|nr:hypothetical protein [Nostoc sp. NMS8]MBN3962239.1 hypothetical protein [Nostoc sp. NMS8]
MKLLRDLLEVLKFKLLMRLPVGFEISFGGWSLTRVEDGIIEGRCVDVEEEEQEYPYLK